MQDRPLPPKRYVFKPLRLIAGLALVAALMLPAYLLLIREPDDPNVQRARLLDNASEAGPDVGLDLGDQAPNFEVSTPDGERVTLADFRGRPLVINFWATWCTSCLTEMPDLKALQEQRGLDAFSVLAINAGEARPQAQEFIDFLDAPFVFGMDPGLVLSDAYNVYGLPLSVFLDSQGVVRGVYRGHAQPEVLDTFVSAAIAAQPPGEIPVVVRLVSTIPRQRTLTVSTEGPGQLSFSSRSLRCDVSYCAEPALSAGLAQYAGIHEVLFIHEEGTSRRLSIEFDPEVISDKQVVTAVQELLVELEDPVYQAPIETRFAPTNVN